MDRTNPVVEAQRMPASPVQIVVQTLLFGAGIAGVFLLRSSLSSTPRPLATIVGISLTCMLGFGGAMWYVRIVRPAQQQAMTKDGRR